MTGKFKMWKQLLFMRKVSSAGRENKNPVDVSLFDAEASLIFHKAKIKFRRTLIFLDSDEVGKVLFEGTLINCRVLQ